MSARALLRRHYKGNSGPTFRLSPIQGGAASTRRRCAPPTSSNAMLGRLRRPARGGKEVVQSGGFERAFALARTTVSRLVIYANDYRSCEEVMQRSSLTIEEQGNEFAIRPYV